MRNLTISLPEDLARWAKVEAAKQFMSLSRFVSEMLRSKRSDPDASATALAEFIAAPRYPISNGGQGYPKREDLYDR